MPRTRMGSLRLFSVGGIDVFLHWSWFLFALLELNSPLGRYASPGWAVAEYVSVFAIVLLHEFGHVLACRQVGGTADRIVLWPLGGLAYVNPPPRPGPFLWSIAAGPLVNLLLMPVLWACAALGDAAELPQTNPDAATFLWMLLKINVGLLIFNLLPIYPLDGGKILQALLWFVVGRAAALIAASVLGLLCAFLLGAAALLWLKDPWLLIVLAFIIMVCINGFRQGLALARLARLARHDRFACPSCGVAPPQAPLWICHQCRARFDTFQQQATCPRCGTRFESTACPECHQRNPLTAWALHAEPAVAPVSGD